jgi:hypothetical protein
MPCIRISIPKDIGIWVKREAPWEALRQLKETIENPLTKEDEDD